LVHHPHIRTFFHPHISFFLASIFIANTRHKHSNTKSFTMKKILASLLFAGVLAACGDNTADDTNLESPAETHPPSEAITDSTAIINDSAIVPDTANGNSNGGDTSRPQ
jgi:hypothetical protein